MAKGTVKWFNKAKGYGFLTDREVTTDVFVHFSEIAGDGFRMLHEGDEVEYELFHDDKGAKARKVMPVQ